MVRNANCNSTGSGASAQDVKKEKLFSSKACNVETRDEDESTKATTCIDNEPKPFKTSKQERAVKTEGSMGEKPGMSYIALISMAIQSHPDKRMLLSEIYGWISERFPFYKLQDKSWRNSIRHNLSLNECFVKCGRSENGKGNYWSIHPANMADFSSGDFRRRRARRRVRKCDSDLQQLCSSLASNQSEAPYSEQRHYGDQRHFGEYEQYGPREQYGGYVPMKSVMAPTSLLASTFGIESVMSREELTQLPRMAEYGHDVTSYHDVTSFKPPSINPCVQLTCSPSSGCSSAVESTLNVNVNVQLCGNSVSDSHSHSSSWQDMFTRLQSDMQPENTYPYTKTDVLDLLC